MFHFYTDRDGQLKSVDSSTDIARCLPPLLDAIGWHGDSSNLLAEAFPHNISRITLTELLNAMANLKFENSILKTTLDEIDPKAMPCLFVQDKGPSFVLIKGGKKSIFAFHGVDVKYVQIEPSSVTGLAVFFKPAGEGNDGLLRAQKDWFYKLMTRFVSTFFLTFFLTFLLNIMAFAFPVFVMSIYNKVLAAESIESLRFWLIGICIFVIANAGFTFFRSMYMSAFSIRIGNIIGSQVLRRILYLPSSQTELAPIGDQISRIKDFESLREFFGGRGAIALMELCFIILLIGCMAIIGGAIAIIPVVAIILFTIFGFAINPMLKRANELASMTHSKKQEFLLEMILHVRVIKYSMASRLWLERYTTLASEAALGFIKSSNMNSLINAFSQTLISASGIATMGFGVFLVLDGKMNAGALIACIFLIWRILSPVQSIYSALTQLGQVRKSIDQLDRLMSMPLAVKPETSMVANKVLLGRLEFSRVYIRYTPDTQPALVGISFIAKRGEILSIVGPTGSGKSTILKLILGMHAPQAGRIFIDSDNVRQMDPILLRKSIAYSPQEDHFFNGTIAQNLISAKPSATLEDLNAAAQKAGVLEDILALPGGFSMKIKENNEAHFSTSFKKRLSLAKAFLRNSKIMLLDNPDKGLDHKQTEQLMKSLEALKKKATVLIITENENFFRVSDSMLWMEEGRIRMGGPSDQVIPAYAKFINS